MTAMESQAAASPSTRRQVALLLGLWWRHMRRRAVRVGEAPKIAGVPGFLLINLISIGYLAPLSWRAVTGDMTSGESYFALHMLGMLLIAFGSGAAKGAAALQLRGMRNDAFLEPLPLRTLATLALQLGDAFPMLVLALTVPLAGSYFAGSLGWRAIVPALLGPFSYAVFVVLAHALVYWARALGPATTARRAAYLGIGINVVGLATAIVPVAKVVKPGMISRLAPMTRWWLHDQVTALSLLGALAVVLLLAYRALIAAERYGFDHLPVESSAPKADKRVQSRARLEWQMMWRHGGRVLFIIFCLALLGLAWLILVHGAARMPPQLGIYLTGLAVYLATLQTLGQAGRAARSDLMARPFLSALPLLPHEVLDGKARALRILVLPVFAILALVAGVSVWNGSYAVAYRAALAIASLYVIIDGAIGIAFLSSGIGVIGIAGGQASSSFSTQLLMMPLFATVLAENAWTASVSFIAVIAVTLETRRAAHLGVRWIDDADDRVERETTVWRALLAATAFFAMQILSARLLDLFAVPAGYLLAGAFGTAAAVLALLTFRNGTRFEAPRFVPHKLWAWPLGALGGGASGLLALQFAKLLPNPSEAMLEAPASSPGELVAIFVTMVVVAPLAEEYFFRGWLQKAIERDLPDHHKRWAFALGALAFALAHIGTYGLPQLVLGLVAGALYAFGGGLWPAMLAHAMHNGVALLAGP